MRNFLLLLIAFGAVGAVGACKRPSEIVVPAPSAPIAAPPTASPPLDKYLHIPQVPRPPLLSQHEDDVLWQTAVTTGAFWQPDGKEAGRPHSNARLLWDTNSLYLSLYAADQDISAPDAKRDGPLWLQDAFTVRIQSDMAPSLTWAVDIAPTGTVTDVRLDGANADATWDSGAQVSIDVDGTINDPSGEDDEEWVVFVALPWAQMGIVAKPGLKLRVQLGRCDIPKGDKQRCGQWGQAPTPDPQGEIILDGSAASPQKNEIVR